MPSWAYAILAMMIALGIIDCIVPRVLREQRSFRALALLTVSFIVLALLPILWLILVTLES